MHFLYSSSVQLYSVLYYRAITLLCVYVHVCIFYVHVFVCEALCVSQYSSSAKLCLDSRCPNIYLCD